MTDLDAGVFSVGMLIGAALTMLLIFCVSDCSHTAREEERRALCPPDGKVVVRCEAPAR